MREPLARAEMLVRRPSPEVFEAFVRPDTLVKFWLDGASGPLAEGAVVDWRFKVPGATATVTVTAFERGRRIGFNWSGGIAVDIRFHELEGARTRIVVTAGGFGDDPVAGAVEATEGFSIVLCDLKTLLEGGRSANLVADKAALIAGTR